MSEKVLIPKTLFLKLIQYHFFDKLELEDSIKSDLEKKLNSIVKRESYENFLNETDPQKKQEFFEKYLNAKERS